jgi:poly(ADP-ribose) glycohydrolase ARH3
MDAAERVCGSLLGAACGDGLGAPFEGQIYVSAQRLLDWSISEDTLTYTDDTAMQRVLATHLATKGGQLDQEALAREFSAQWHTAPHRGYGAGPPRIFRAALAGHDWRGIARGLYGGSGSLGNGGAMRTAPAAFIPGDLNHRVDIARQQAEITHTHPLALDGAAALCAGIAVASKAESPFSAGWFLAQVRPYVQTREFALALDAVKTVVDNDSPPSEVGNVLGRDITALGSVPTALALFLRTPQNPADAILNAVLAGGDTDTIAAMTGALVGAHCGEAAIPSHWRSRLEAGSAQRREASSLAGLL